MEEFCAECIYSSNENCHSKELAMKRTLGNEAACTAGCWLPCWAPSFRCCLAIPAVRYLAVLSSLSLLLAACKPIWGWLVVKEERNAETLQFYLLVCAGHTCPIGSYTMEVQDLWKAVHTSRLLYDCRQPLQ